MAALLIAVPMMRPQMMAVSVAPPRITVPNLKPVHLVERMTQAAISAAPTINIAASTAPLDNTRRFVFPLAPGTADNDAPPMGIGPTAMGDGSPLSAIRGVAAVATVVTPHVRDTRPVRVSQGISNGMLLTPITPAYPPIAKAAGVQGTVVIDAVISKAGRVESLNVASGPAMLRAAALDAVARARYAPYKLNGDPVEVQTVITVVFRLGT
jgi:protein TonB